MEELQQHVDEYLSTENSSIGSIIQLVTQDGGKILNLVECLSTSLTHTSLEIRTKGTALLSEFINCFPPNAMSESEVEHFVLFYCNRLQDHHSVQPVVIYGFLGLTLYQNITDLLVTKILQTLFAEVHVQSLVQADRRNVYNLFSNLLQTHLNLLKEIAPDFLLGYIQAIESESDPRNLMICFANSKIVLENLNFSLFTEDLFEVLSCYFPIDFTPPKDDTFFITKDDLVKGLRTCLVSKSEFGPYAVPLFVEKLSSDVPGAKKDALLTFTEGLKIYLSEDVERFLQDIWLCIRKDFILSDDADISHLYLDFVCELVLCLTKSLNLNPIMQIVDLLIKDCLLTLKDPEMAIIAQCGDLIKCICNASSATYRQVIESIVPSFEIAFSNFTSPKNRHSLLEFIYKIYNINTTLENPSSVLLNFSERFVPILYCFLDDDGENILFISSLKCLSIIIKQFASSPQIIDAEIFIQRVMKPVVSRKLQLEMVAYYKPLIINLSYVYKKEKFESMVLCRLKDLVDKSNEKRYVNIQCISLLQFCYENETYFESTVSYLVDVLNDFEHDTPVLLHALELLTEIFDNGSKDINKELSFYKVIDFMLKRRKAKNILENFLALLISNFRQIINSEKQEIVKFVEQIFFNASSNSHTEKTVLVIARSIFSQISPVILTEAVNVTMVLDKLWSCLLSYYEQEFICECIGISFSSIVNKLPDATSVIQKFIDVIESNLVTNSSPCILLLSWICKALILNWQSGTEPCIIRLVDYLKSEQYGLQTSKVFVILLKEYPNVLSKQENAIVKLMYKQRFSQLVLPLLISNYQDGSDAVKANLVTAISCTLQGLPSQLLQKHLKELFPLLLHSLSACSSHSIVISTLSTVDAVLDENKAILTTYVSSLVSCLLKLTNNPHMDVRILSVKSLEKISKFPTHLVYPLRNDVIKCMKERLGDRKRLVRKEVVVCNNLWHLLEN